VRPTATATPRPTATTVPSGSFRVSGVITTSSGFRLNNVTVTIFGNGISRSTQTINGEYSFSSLPNGTYVVRPQYSGLVFTPESRTITVNGGNVTGANFIASVG
jgi:hypothetical protein